MNHHHFPESVLVTDNQSARDPGSCEGLSQTQRETDPAFHSNSQYCVELLRAISSCWSLDCPGTAAAIRDNQPTGGMVRVSYRRSLSRSVMHSGDSSAKMNTESQASRRLLFRSVHHFVRVLCRAVGYYPQPTPTPTPQTDLLSGVISRR